LLKHTLERWIRPILEHEYTEDIDLVFEATPAIKVEPLATNSSASETLC
jgi:hypothetical protein